MNWNMLWIRSTYKLPVENREILIKCKSIVGLGYFDRSEKKFILKDGTAFDCMRETVEWMEIRLREHSDINRPTIFNS